MATKRPIRLTIVAVSAALALAMSGCSATPRGVTVVEKDRQFVPSSVTVAVGDVVTFDNRDGLAHRVLINDTDLGEQQPGVSVTWTAPAEGTFRFECISHSTMTGKVIVGADGGASPTATAPAGSGS